MNLAQKIRLKLCVKTKHYGRDINRFCRLDEKFYREARGSRIMIYHGICLKDHTRFNPIFLKLKTFEQHLQFYKKYFNVISLDDYYQERFSKDKFNICITFDDGYANNHKYVLPLLHKYQLPATFFITAIREIGYDILWNDFLGIASKYGPRKIIYKNERFYKGLHNKYISEQSGKSLVEILRSGNFDTKAEMMKELYLLAPTIENKPHDIDYWLQMTMDQIKELSLSPFANIGAHGYYHNDLARIDISSVADELCRSKKFLENIINRPVTSLALPYGTYNSEVIKVATNTGYSQLLCMDFHHSADHLNPLMRERFTVNPFISTSNQMHATITRNYE